ncbi:hypothetical protein H4683_000329 [Filibacter limicola]|uniref:Uncharacterized protein n=1 Tax=Sporosarcina limicola TaxID=34101 RepID=A0A927RBD0_9BACL|nr:hypothetical protein [Sporosarcina limicola]
MAIRKTVMANRKTAMGHPNYHGNPTVIHSSFKL